MKKLILILALLLFPSLVSAAVFNLTNTTTITWDNDTENITGSVVILKDLVATSPITGGANDVLPGADGDVFINVSDADDDDSTKGVATFNNTDFDVVSGLVTITNNNSIQNVIVTNATAAGGTNPGVNFNAGDNATLAVANDTTNKYVNVTYDVKAGIFQPLDADLTDLADGSLTGTKVGNNGSIQNIVFQNDTADEGVNSLINIIAGSGITVAAENSTYGYNYTIGSSAGGGNVSQSGAEGVGNFTQWTAANEINDTGIAITSATNWDEAYDNFFNKSIDADDDDSTKGICTFNNTNFDAVSGLITIASDGVKAVELDVADVSDDIAADIAEGELKDSIIVSADIKDGEVATGDIKDYTIADADIANSTLTDLKRKEFNFQFTVDEPDVLSNATGIATTARVIWSNIDTRTYTIGEVKAFTDVDNYNFTLYKSFNYSNISSTADVYLHNISVADNGGGCFLSNTTSFDNATIEAGSHLIFQSGENINVTNVHIIVKGNFS